MNDLTIDVQILRIRSGASDAESIENYYDDTVRLTKLLEDNDDFYLVFDNKDKIKNQYLKQLKGHFGEKWIMRMADKDKIRTIPYENLRHLNRRVYVSLSNSGFTANKGEDLKYVETAVKTNCHIIVTYDPHFYNNARILNRLPVYIKKCRDCIC